MMHGLLGQGLPREINREPKCFGTLRKGTLTGVALVHLPGSDSLDSEGHGTVIVHFQAKEEPVKSTEGGGGRGKKGRTISHAAR